MKNALFFLFLSTFAGLFFAGCKRVEEMQMPVYRVAGPGTTRESADQLAKSLTLDSSLMRNGRFRDENGRIAVIDTKKHLSVPSKRLGSEKADEEGQAVQAEALDREALRSVKTISPREAEAKFSAALRQAQLLPEEATVRSKNNVLTIADSAGRAVSNTPINTRVMFDLQLGGIPLEGPGARISASFSGDGSVSQLKYAYRKLEKGELVTLVDSNKIKEQCTAFFNRSAPNGKFERLDVKTRLFYYAPPLDQKGVQTVIPYYECRGTAVQGDRRVELMPQIFPAVADEKYVPRVSMKTSMNNNKVEATIDIAGGSPPYQVQWSSPSIGMRSGQETRLSFDLFRRANELQEVLHIKVIDNNGIMINAYELITFNPALLPPVFPLPAPGDAATRDYGTENAVLNQFGGLDQGFANAMNADGVNRKFSWGGMDAWEQDFKKAEDNNWVDDTDITFYVGHGGVGFFTFEDGTHNDGAIDNDDATGDWGNKDLEWLAIYSCQVLGKGGDGQEPFRNWKQEFAGLHLMLGFHTNAGVSNNFSGKFASNMLSAGMTVSQAWFDAADDENIGEPVVMGVFRARDGAWNYNDYFHGKGAIGPDIRGADIGLGWYVH